MFFNMAEWILFEGGQHLQYLQELENVIKNLGYEIIERFEEYIFCGAVEYWKLKKGNIEVTLQICTRVVSQDARGNYRTAVIIRSKESVMDILSRLS